ncbi:hypothetical protein PanWU01x14_063210 [Parasponia andersonii]|uniref:Uncharacterized protein n=1 Tax=Parasponia andersonii TaxID=3476 RepID=A0A2P5DHQ5_PARAD|nr:hypothetical protein PanWU01x14_063210 [Parasponia andersonii]
MHAWHTTFRHDRGLAHAQDVHMPVSRVEHRVLKLGLARAWHNILLGHAKHDMRHERTYLSQPAWPI